MKPLDDRQLGELFTRAQIDVADPAGGIGQELRYRRHALRRVVVHFVESDPLEYCIDVVGRMLKADDEWVLITRYGSIRDLGLLAEGQDARALSFSAVERDALASYLCRRSTALAAVSADLYVLGGRGEILVTWDHHSADEGVDIQLQSVNAAGQLLLSLNERGVELELFYTG